LDIVVTVELPPELRNDSTLIDGCMGNALLISELEASIKAAGFEQVRINPEG